MRKKREREITLLYGISLIRDDVLNHPLPEQSSTDRMITIVHCVFAFTIAVTMAGASIILILSIIPTKR